MKVLRTIGTLTIGAAAGFVACGALTVRGVLKSERHRKALVDMVSEKVNDELFGKKFEPKQFEPKNSSHSRVSYRPYNKQTPRSRVYYKVRYEEMVESACDPKEIVFDTASLAEEVLDNIKEIIDTYGYVTVADVCDLCDLNHHRFDDEYGWTTSSDMHIEHVDDKYILYLPKANLLD